MIVNIASLAAFRTGPLATAMLQMDVDLSRFQLEFNPLYGPRRLDSQDLSI
jgi:hypothetical protein